MNCRVWQLAAADSFCIAEHLPSTFVPTAGHLTIQVPQPPEFAIHKKKMVNSPGSAQRRRGGGGEEAHLELADA